MIKTPAIPETIMIGDWSVVSGKGMVSIKDKKFRVPLGNTRQDLAVRVHEYGHIKFSPLRKNKEIVTDKKLLLADAALEDFRVNHLITGKKVTVLKHVLTPTKANAIKVHPSPFMQSLLYVACYHYTGIKNLKQRLTSLTKKDHRYLRDCMNTIKEKPTYANSFKIAKRIVKRFPETSVRDRREGRGIVVTIAIKSSDKTPETSDATEGSEKPKGKPKDSITIEIKSEKDKKLKKEAKPKPKTKPKPKPKLESESVRVQVIEISVDGKNAGKNSPITNFIKEGVQYGALSASKTHKFVKEKPELTIVDNTHKMVSIEKLREKTDCGMTFRYPERVLTDGLVFGTKKTPRIIGTILIDSSGSMRFDRKDLVTISKKSGGATIAAYVAEPTTHSGTKNKGNLFILAKGKKVISKLPSKLIRGIHNIVDLEAVEWLCTQPSPRILVTDAMFTSLSDSGYGKSEELNIEIIDQVNELCKANSITWLRDVSDLHEVLKNLKAGRRFKKPKHEDMLGFMKKKYGGSGRSGSTVRKGSVASDIIDYMEGKSKLR